MHAKVLEFVFDVDILRDPLIWDTSLSVHENSEGRISSDYGESWQVTGRDMTRAVGQGTKNFVVDRMSTIASVATGADKEPAAPPHTADPAPSASASAAVGGSSHPPNSPSSARMGETGGVGIGVCDGLLLGVVDGLRSTMFSAFF